MGRGEKGAYESKHTFENLGACAVVWRSEDNFQEGRLSFTLLVRQRLCFCPAECLRLSQSSSFWASPLWLPSIASIGVLELTDVDRHICLSHMSLGLSSGRQAPTAGTSTHRAILLPQDLSCLELQNSLAFSIQLFICNMKNQCQRKVSSTGLANPTVMRHLWWHSGGGVVSFTCLACIKQTLGD